MSIFSPSIWAGLVLGCLLSLVVSTPVIGIQKDFLKENDQIHSYSGIIQFKNFGDRDDEWPGEYMSPGQLVQLAKVAYDEMVAISRATLEGDKDLPNAMIALATGRWIFFASSMKTGAGLYFAPVEKYHDNIMVEYFNNCRQQGSGRHRNGGRCAEPNVLELYYAFSGRNEGPPKVDDGANVKARMAPWLRFPGQSVGNEFNYKPCVGPPFGFGYGCTKLIRDYDIEAIADKTPNPTGQDEWKFELVVNPRAACGSWNFRHRRRLFTDSRFLGVFLMFRLP